MPRAFRIVQRNALVFRQSWHGPVIMSLLLPTLYLGSIGIGVGGMVDRGGALLPGGVPYLVFLAPGLLASTCMQSASFESSFPILGKMTWQRNYDAIAGTPMRVIDIVVGELAWIALRLLLMAVSFTVVLGLLGAARSPLVVAAIPAAVLTGLAFSAPIMAYAASLDKGQNLNGLLRFVVTPLFLFSGAFFPVSRLPEPLQWVAVFTPLYHGVELARGAALQTLAWRDAAGHAAYLLALLLAGMLVAVRVFRLKLQP